MCQPRKGYLCSRLNKVFGGLIPTDPFVDFSSPLRRCRGLGLNNVLSFILNPILKIHVEMSSEYLGSNLGERFVLEYFPPGK